MSVFKTQETELFYRALDAVPDKASLVFIWGHGWGQDHHALLLMAETLKHYGGHYLIDFNGFGESPQPVDIWGSDEYARVTSSFVAHIQKQHPEAKIIWGCHSFGGRVGLQMASRADTDIDGMIFLGGAGLKPYYPLWKKIRLWVKVRIFKTFKFLTRYGVSEDWVIKTFTKGDYRSAGPMRKIFVKVVNEDLAAEAAKVTCPTIMFYGADDQHAPPEIGQRLQKLIKNSELHILNGFDHFNILNDGRHQVAAIVDRFIEKNFKA